MSRFSAKPPHQTRRERHMEYKLLSNINSPKDLSVLSHEEIALLCEEIRHFLIEKVGEHGGHLASNLGVTELSVAMHRVFNSPEDHFIFDVGHQSYVHKLLTGRRERFDELRIPGGLSGFTKMKESEHDAFGAGHSSTSISAALGYAEADALAGKDTYTVCVTGDGAYTGGMIHEAINNCKPDLKLVVILNENGMSISRNKGAFASYLSGVRSSKGYIGAKARTDNVLSHIPLIGKPIRAILSLIKRGIKRLVFTSNYFEDLGFYYIGPIDGNDYKRLERALIKAKRLEKCVFVHVLTTKGKGCEDAEQAPETYHSVGGSHTPTTYHSELADELIRLAENDEKILAITAAMGVGTGLCAFEKRFKQRYFDVGIAEEHALTFSAGLAAGGYKPFTAIYSTFLQRGYDSIIHDIALQELPVRLMIDRAGLSVGDGATHHGIFDVPFLSHVPGIEIYSPATYDSLRAALGCAAGADMPVAIRYPNSAEPAGIADRMKPMDASSPLGLKCDFDHQNPPKNLIVTYGTQVKRAIAAADILADRGIGCGVILVEKIRPNAEIVKYISEYANGRHIVFAEEGIKTGGFASTTIADLAEMSAIAECKIEIAAIDDNFASPDAPCDLYDYVGLSPERLAERFLRGDAQ